MPHAVDASTLGRMKGLLVFIAYALWKKEAIEEARLFGRETEAIMWGIGRMHCDPWTQMEYFVADLGRPTELKRRTPEEFDALLNAFLDNDGTSHEKEQNEGPPLSIDGSPAKADDLVDRYTP